MIVKMLIGFMFFSLWKLDALVRPLHRNQIYLRSDGKYMKLWMKGRDGELVMPCRRSVRVLVYLYIRINRTVKKRFELFYGTHTATEVREQYLVIHRWSHESSIVISLLCSHGSWAKVSAHQWTLSSLYSVIRSKQTISHWSCRHRPP